LSFLLGIRYLPDARHVLAVGHPLGQRVDRRRIHGARPRDELHLRDVLVRDLDALGLQRRVHLLDAGAALGAERLRLAAQRLAVLLVDERLQVRLRCWSMRARSSSSVARSPRSACTSALSPAPCASRSWPRAA
jgi:hypothetical protein